MNRRYANMDVVEIPDLARSKRVLGSTHYMDMTGNGYLGLVAIGSMRKKSSFYAVVEKLKVYIKGCSGPYWAEMELPTTHDLCKCLF